MRSYHPLQKLKNILDISYEFLEKLWEYVNRRATNSNQKALIGQNSSCYFNIRRGVISNLACACIWPIAPRLTFFNAIEGFHSLHALTWKCQIRIYSSNIFNRIFFYHPGGIGLLLFLLDHIFDITYESVNILSVQFANLLYSKSNVELVRETVIPKLLTWILKLILRSSIVSAVYQCLSKEDWWCF